MEYCHLNILLSTPGLHLCPYICEVSENVLKVKVNTPMNFFIINFLLTNFAIHSVTFVAEKELLKNTYFFFFYYFSSVKY